MNLYDLLFPHSSKRKTIFSATSSQQRGMHTDPSELFMAVAPYLPQMADQIMETVDSLPRIAETVGRDVHSVAETTTGLPQLQGGAGPSSSSTLCNLTVETFPFPSTLEIDVVKIKENLIQSYGGQLNGEEIVSLSRETIEFKTKILQKLALLAGEDNGPLLFNTTGADEILTTLERTEYKRSYLQRILKSLMRKGKSSCYYQEFLQKRLEAFPNAWMQYLKIGTLPEEVIEKKILTATSEFLMKDD